MQTGNYIKVDDVLFMAAGLAGDKSYENLPYGFYIQLINDAFEELNMDSKMLDGHADLPMPQEHLTIPLPKDCFNVLNIWLYDGDICDIGLSRKVWWKRNFYTQGNGYLANRTGRNTNDPYYLNDTMVNARAAGVQQRSVERYYNQSNVNNVLFYNVQNGNLMLSESCRMAGMKVHIHYNSTGCEVGDAAIIPRFYKTAIEDYTIEAAMRFRMANEPSMARNWQSLQQMYAIRLDKDGFNGSWHKAVMKSKSMSSAERQDLATYMGRGAWQNGM